MASPSQKVFPETELLRVVVTVAATLTLVVLCIPKNGTSSPEI
jgi:hypothetical protein